MTDMQKSYKSYNKTYSKLRKKLIKDLEPDSKEQAQVIQLMDELDGLLDDIVNTLAAFEKSNKKK